MEFNLERTPKFSANSRVQGRLTYHGDRLGHDNYVFKVTDEFLVLRMGKRYQSLKTETEVRESLNREAGMLQRLATSDFPYTAPEFVCIATDEDGVIVGLIESHVGGTPLSFFDAEHFLERRLEAIAEVAAAVHQLPTGAFEHLEAARDRHSHVLSLLEALPDSLFSEYPLAAAVREWIHVHLPDGLSALLHGDLLPQNLLLNLMKPNEVAVIDWECAHIGDPACDLAIVTRGARKPHKQSGGFQLLLDAYNEHAPTPVSATDVHIHELLMHLNWLAETDQMRKSGVQEGHGPDFYHDQLNALARRVCK